MYRLGSYKGVNGVFLRFFEMFFPGHALSRQNKALKEGSRGYVGGGFTFLASEIISFTCKKSVNFGA